MSSDEIIAIIMAGDAAVMQTVSTLQNRPNVAPYPAPLTPAQLAGIQLPPPPARGLSSTTVIALVGVALVAVVLLAND